MTLRSMTTMGFSCRYQVACMFFSLVLECMSHAYGLWVMICHWHGEFPRLTMDFPSLAVSWIFMVIGYLFSFFVLVGFHVSLALVESLVLEALI